MTARVTSPLFIGRGSELKALDDALSDAEAGRPTGVLLSGDAGVGKSRLLDEFALHAESRGARMVFGHCVEAAEGELPYAPFSAALRALAADLDSDELDRVLGPTRSGLGLLVPDLGAAPGGETVADPGQAQLFDLLLGAFGRLAGDRPAVLVLEDIHWADSSTRSLLRFLIRSTTSERLTIVASYRSDELHRRHPLRPLLSELDREPRVRRVAVAPFSRDEIAAQVEAIRDARAEPDVVDRLFERSEGNAFFAEELLAAADAGDLPESLRDVLLVRLEQLSDPAQRVVRAAAAAGRSVDHRLLGAVVGGEPSALLEPLREAVSAQVLVARGQSYEFRHALLREAAYDDLLPGEREELHMAIARALEAQPELARTGATVTAELAHHWHAAQEPRLALPASITAGREAERVYAFAEAQAHYERALTIFDIAPEQEVDRAELMGMAAGAAQQAGDYARAVALARGATERIDATADPVRASLQYEALGRYQEEFGRDAEAVAAFARARELMPPEPTAERAHVIASEARWRGLGAEFEVSERLAEEALAIAREVGSREVQASALSTLLLSYTGTGRAADAIEGGHEAIAIAEELGLGNELIRAYTNTAQVLEETGDLDAALALTRQGVESAVRHGAQRSWGGFLVSETSARLARLGRLREASATVDDALAAAPDTIYRNALAEASADALMLRGELEAARREVARAHRRGVEIGAVLWAGPAAATGVELELWAGDPDAAVRILIEALESVEDGEWLIFSAPLYALGAWAYVEQAVRARTMRKADDEPRAGAAGLLARLERLLAAFKHGVPAPIAAWTAQFRGELTRMDGAGDPAAWADARGHWDRISARFRSAYCGYREAEATLGADGDRDAVRDLLLASRDYAAEQGARRLLEEVEALARRARIDVADGSGDALDALPTPAESAGLTAREAEVLVLVAEGRTNRQIAEVLFISDKTASVHVSRIMAKLGAGNRGEAAAIARRLGIHA